MACLDELIAAVESISNSVSAMASSSSGCGCGSRGAGSEDAPVSLEDTGAIDDPGQDTPPGFNDRDEYKSYKCDVATWIVDNQIVDANWLVNVDNLALITAGFIAAAILTPIPGARVVAIVALLSVTFIGLGVATASLLTWRDALVAVRDDLICALYAATNATGARSEFQAILYAEIDNQTSDPVIRALVRQLADYWTPNGVVNALFVKDEGINLAGVSGDCADCIDCLPIWCFDDGVQGFTFSNQDLAPAFSTGAYDAATESLKVYLELPLVPNVYAQGIWTLSLASGTYANSGDWVKMSYGATSDGNDTGYQLRVYYTDATLDFTPVTLNDEVGTLQLDLTVNKEIDRIEVWVSRSTSASPVQSQSNNYVLDVSASFSDPGVCPQGPCDA